MMPMGEPDQLLSPNHMSTFDACFANPCQFGSICKTMPREQVPAGFLCLNELELNKESSAARQVYRNAELMAKDAIRFNLDLILKSGKASNTILKMLSSKMPITSSNNEQTVSLTLRSLLIFEFFVSVVSFVN